MPRVVFTFDDRSYGTLHDVKQRGEFNSLGTAVRESLQISDILQQQAEEGFDEVVVRNSSTKQEKTILIPSLRKLRRRK
jgi:hypothetical protein